MLLFPSLKRKEKPPEEKKKKEKIKENKTQALKLFVLYTVKKAITAGVCAEESMLHDLFCGASSPD